MRIVVGLSGGVDSAVSALFLKHQGHEVIGVFMKNWEEKNPQNICDAEKEAAEARLIAEKLQIPFYTVNFSDQYQKKVFTRFLCEHKKFRTPSPDILCNQFIKFDAFLKYAEKLGAEKIATGHYAKICTDKIHPIFKLEIPADKTKDQTYFLYALTQLQLSKTIFPLADLTKSEVRDIAKKNDFSNAYKKDSTGICFIGERNYRLFLQQFLPKNPGEVITTEEKKVGTHDGLSFYTLGQRRDLHIGGIKNAKESPWYVIQKIAEKNQLVVSQDRDDPLLYSDEIFSTDFHWICGNPTKKSQPVLLRLRHLQELFCGNITVETAEKSFDGRVRIIFEVPQRAVTLGQSVVVYDEAGTTCLGGGTIDGK